jgi:methyl-accepting chemotaxis protein
MGSNIKQNSSNAVQTEIIAKKASEDAESSGRVVAEAVEAMRSISERITVVEEIARQTNMLALNAAIEAARAGESGRGFAVVAGEVRKLAERSGSAASDITKLATETMDKSLQAGTLLAALVPDIRKTAELVAEISASSAEQADGTEQILKAVSELDDIIRRNAASSEEFAATSEELSGQAERLRAAVSYFSTSAGEQERLPAILRS